MNIIAEIVRGNPHKGIYPKYAQEFRPVELAQYFDNAGADYISVRCSGAYNGDEKWIKSIRNGTCVPIISRNIVNRKAGVDSAKMMGSDLIVISTSYIIPDTLKSLVDYAYVCDLIPIVEVTTLNEINVAAKTSATWILVENYNRVDGKVNLERTFNLYDSIPLKFTHLISYGGINTEEDAFRLANLGIHSIVLNEALICSDNYVRTVKSMKNAYNKL